MKQLTLVILCLSGSAWRCQILEGSVTDSLGAPVPFIAVALLNAADSSIYKGVNTDERGAYVFNIPKGRYIVRIQEPGYAEFFSGQITTDSLEKTTLPVIKLRSDGRNLEEVTITAIKRPIEFKNGNITVNVEGSPLATGNSVYDLLSRMPGVTVENENISIQGKSGVSIYIDDRRQPVSGQQLVNLLRSMSASSVEKIEIIRNPTAKYDAAGTAGIINIKTKRLKQTGISGTAGYNFSKGYAVTNNANVSLNYKGKHVSIFSSVEAYEGTIKHTSEFNKVVQYEGQSTVMRSRSTDMDVARYATINLGLDWHIDRMNIIGFRFQGIPGYALRTKSGNTALSQPAAGYDNLIYNRSVPNTWYLANYNFNAEHLFDTSGTKLKFSADFYGPYADLYKSDYEYHFTDNDLNETHVPRYDIAENDLDLRIFSGRLDFEKKLGKKLNLEAGVKAANQDIFSNYVFRTRDENSGEFLVDTMFTNRYVYHELITAGYADLQLNLKKFSYQLGLRAENTDVNSSSDLKAFEYRRSYFKLFPSLALNYHPSEKHAWSAVFNRRLWRPDYNSFNPYYVFNNLFSISKGNPYLLPEIYYHLEVSHVFKSKFTNTFSYSRSQNPIRPQSHQVDSTGVTYSQPGNLEFSNEARYFIFYNADILKWWHVSCNAGGWYYDFRGTVDDKSLNNAAFSYNLWANNVLLLPERFKLEISGWYVGPWLYGGFYRIRPRGAVNIGLKRSFLKDKLNVSIAFQDVFFTARTYQEVNFYNQNYTLVNRFDSRRVNVNLSYNFGSARVQKREIKRAEEQGRIGR